MKTIQQDLKSNNVSLNEATDVHCVFTPETDVYAILVVHARKERERPLQWLPLPNAS